MAARQSTRLLVSPLPESARRLFWSWPGGKPPSEERAAVAVLLAEGGRREWLQVEPRALAACARDLPLHGSLREAWALYAEEEVAMADGRERVMDDEQRHVLRVAAAVLPAFGFELAGGTALAAAYLGHRRSEDLDLFTGEREIGPALEAFRDALRREGLAVNAEPHHVGRTFARLLVGRRPVKVELGCDSPFHIRPSSRTLEGMPVRSLEDLAADKVLALFGRAEARDFVDVYWLLRTHFDWSELLSLAQRKDPGFREEWFVRALRQVDRVGPGCAELLVPLDFGDLRSEFVRAATRLIRRATQQERGKEPGLEPMPFR
jgi:hypothetical protein